MYCAKVAPFAGAWIEMAGQELNTPELPVAPFAGAWIEMPYASTLVYFKSVAPFAGAWIEIADSLLYLSDQSGRSLRGSVD